MKNVDFLNHSIPYTPSSGKKKNQTENDKDTQEVSDDNKNRGTEIELKEASEDS